MKYKKIPYRIISTSALFCIIAVFCFSTDLKGELDFTKQNLPVQPEDSIIQTGNSVSFTVPQDYSETEGWKLYVTGRAVYADGFSQSLHYFEEEKWIAGKMYTIPIGKEITELILTVKQPGADERIIDLLR